MKVWSRFPVFRFLIPFSAGILICIFSDKQHFTGFLLTAVAGFSISWLFTTRNYATGKYASRWLAGIPFYCCFFGLGFSLTWLHQSVHHHSHFSNFPNGQIMIGEIIENPALTKRGHRMLIKIKYMKSGSSTIASRGQLLLNITDSLHRLRFDYGDLLAIPNHYSEVPPSRNPGSFNYKRYLESKNTWHQAYAESSEVKILCKGNPQNLFVLACSFRNIMLEKLEKYIDGKNELGVAGALLLGYEEWLDADLEQSYSAAGVLHVLCVSGMHVGLIYVILAWSLSWMEKKKWLRNFRYLLLLLLIWFYAMVTGFSPSVIRASAMITFIIAGKWLMKEAGIYNILCSSCFLMFLLNPYLLISAGFQLSFLAVCGIIFIVGSPGTELEFAL